MHFSTDQQTIDDLKIFGRGGDFSVYGLFNNTWTRGGAAVLEQFFREPLSGAEAIRRRITLFRYFADAGRAFPFVPEWFDHLEQYLANTDERTRLRASDASLGNRLTEIMSTNTEAAIIHRGIAAAIALAHACKEFLGTAGEPAAGKRDTHNPYQEEASAMALILSGEAFTALLQQSPKRKPSAEQAENLDGLLRFRFRSSVRKLLDRIYFLDVCMTVGRMAAAKNWTFPIVQDTGTRGVRLQGLYHPALAHPVSNSITITPENNVVFLTGANMAGKSTFMKSLGIALYLGHMGFPVAAESMEFAVLDGLLTTINLSDNLGMGASHFYAEVLRVKKVAEELNRGRNLFVIFDELFRGTNVKDAYEGTLAITEAFASRRSSIFVLSTHIIEAGEVLRERCDNISFRYLPTRMQGNQPVYTYQLEEGITDDRHGMVIIRNEGILDMLHGSAPAASFSDFLTDNQTLQDLNLTGKFRRGSVFSIFCQVKTTPGERLLDQHFRHPLRDVEAINQRSRLFRHIGELSLSFPLDGAAMEEMENFLDGEGPGNPVLSLARAIRHKAAAALAKDEAWASFTRGLQTTVRCLRETHQFLTTLLLRDPKSPCQHALREAREVLEDPALAAMLQDTDPQQWSLPQIARYDYLLRKGHRDRLQKVRELLASLDLWIAVGNLAKEKGWCYAEALPAEADSLRMAGLRHPALNKAVGNDIRLDAQTNMLFLTGANMAGKSTFMKSFGIAVYLAHMGFPIAADSMAFSVRDGLFSSINVSDDLNQGYSHFYAEVLRVKGVAEAVRAGRRLVVLFDELFKGTNVKDAYDGTVAVTEAFSLYPESVYIISTHITEAGEELRTRRNNFRFAFLPTVLEDGRPRYTYRLQEGIATDRVGMTIIENEKILQIIQQPEKLRAV